jgi:hypothetical protein
MRLTRSAKKQLDKLLASQQEDVKMSEDHLNQADLKSEFAVQ